MRKRQLIKAKWKETKKKTTRKINDVGLDEFAAWFFEMFMLLLLLSHFSRARLCATP